MISERIGKAVDVGEGFSALDVIFDAILGIPSAPPLIAEGMQARQALAEAHRRFARDGLLEVSGLLVPETLAELGDILCVHHRIYPGMFAKPDDAIPSCGAHPVTEALLVDLLPFAEMSTGLSLEPAYSYVRLYGKGDSLPRHVDRVPDEITISLPLMISGNDSWALWIRGRDGCDRCLHQEVGDVLVFRGMELEHWRGPLAGEEQLQTFLHYVDCDGPYRHAAYDGRQNVIFRGRGYHDRVLASH